MDKLNTVNVVLSQNKPWTIMDRTRDKEKESHKDIRFVYHLTRAQFFGS